MKKPAIVSIESGRKNDIRPEPPPASAGAKKKFAGNQHTRRQFVALFFGLGYSTTQAAKMSGHSRADGEEALRQVGYHAWLQRAGRAA